MTKAQREKAERLMLKQTLETHPKLKEIMDAMIDNPKPEIMDAVAPEIEKALKKARLDGVLIGWNSFALRAIENIKSMTTIEQVMDYFKAEADSARERLKLPKDKEKEQEAE